MFLPIRMRQRSLMYTYNVDQGHLYSKDETNIFFQIEPYTSLQVIRNSQTITLIMLELSLDKNYMYHKLSWIAEAQPFK